MKNLKFTLATFFILIFILTLSLATGRKMGIRLTKNSLDPVATHNMLVVGDSAIYLSHLPMFQEKGEPVMPHRYQVILEVGFTKMGSNPQAEYIKDRQSHPNMKIYTINPEPFVLPTLISRDLHKDSLRKFTGTIFRGHLEKGGKSILADADVTVKHVVYFQQFDPGAKKPAQLQYLLFGKGKELFLAHLITSPPDFDQILSVSDTANTFSDEELAKGVKVVFPGTVNASTTRLKENQPAEGILNADNTPNSQNIHLRIKREFYFEEGELQLPPNFETTAEEKKTGFR